MAAQSVNDISYALLTLIPDSYYKNNGLTIFPVLSLPMGGEQQALGNAYTAVARDISFFEANPAASPLLETTQIAVDHQNIVSDINLETVGWSERWGNLGVGAYAKLLHSEFTALGIRGEQIASSAYTESVLGVNVGYTFFRDFYFSGISVGANLKIAYRDIPAELYSRVTGLNGTDQSAVGFMTDIGVLTRFNFLKGYVARDKNLSIGAAIKDLGPLVEGEPLPTTFSAGISYQPVRFLMVTGDFNLPINLQDPSQSEAPGFATGFALQFVDFFSVKAGFQLKGGNPRISVGGDINLKDISFLINYTVDLSTQFKIPDHLGIQARLDLGDNGRAALSAEVDKLYIDALVSLSKSDYQTVIDLCGQALKIDPSFTPAKDTLALAKRSMSLVDQIESVRNETSGSAGGQK